MPSQRVLTEEIVKDLIRLQSSPGPWYDKDDNAGFPRMIAAGNGGSIVVSRKIDQNIAAVADQLRANEPTLALRFTLEEWRTAVRRAFGPALFRIELDQEPVEIAETVLEQIRAELDKHVSDQGVREFAFGCSLFGNENGQAFGIGPVRFEPRLEWLDRKHGIGAVSAISRRRIEQVWAGKRLGKRRRSIDSIHETDILDTIGSCTYCCSVATEGLGGGAGQEKALTAARLAITAVALMWPTPSKVLEGMNLLFDRHPRLRRVLPFIPGKIALAASSWSHMPPHGPSLKAGKWEETLATHRDYFAVVGDILTYVLSPSGTVARPNMMNTLAQALLWFHEGCRETVTLMAIVKFSAALDALAHGKKAPGIRRLVNTRLRISDDQPLWGTGPTLKSAVSDFYDYGRSRTVHGTNDKLGHDWTETRGLSEQLGRLCLLTCIYWAAENPASDDPSDLSQPGP